MTSYSGMSLNVTSYSGKFSSVNTSADIIMAKISHVKNRLFEENKCGLIFVVDSNVDPDWLSVINTTLNDIVPSLEEKGRYVTVATYYDIVYSSGDENRKIVINALNNTKRSYSQALSGIFQYAKTVYMNMLVDVHLLAGRSNFNVEVGDIPFESDDDYKIYMQGNKPNNLIMHTVSMNFDDRESILPAIGEYDSIKNIADLISYLRGTIDTPSPVATNCQLLLPSIPSILELPEGYIPVTMPENSLILSKDSNLDDNGLYVIQVDVIRTDSQSVVLVFPFGYTTQEDLFPRMQGKEIVMTYTNSSGKPSLIGTRISSLDESKVSGLPLENYYDYYKWIAYKKCSDAIAISESSDNSYSQKMEDIKSLLFQDSDYPKSMDDIDITGLSPIEITNLTDMISKINDIVSSSNDIISDVLSNVNEFSFAKSNYML